MLNCDRESRILGWLCMRPSSGESGLQQLLAQEPGLDAVFACNDPMALGALQAARKLGRPVHIRDFERSFTRQGREKLGQYRSDLTEARSILSPQLLSPCWLNQVPAQPLTWMSKRPGATKGSDSGSETSAGSTETIDRPEIEMRTGAAVS